MHVFSQTANQSDFSHRLPPQSIHHDQLTEKPPTRKTSASGAGQGTKTTNESTIQQLPAPWFCYGVPLGRTQVQ